jgi:hypothetical protein
MWLRHPIRRLALGFFAGLVLQAPALAQDQRDEQFYYPGSFNWTFLKNYPEGARLFNAFDYGHAVLYEKLYTTDGEATERSLEKEYRYLTTDLLVRPPRLAIAEEAVMPRYAKLAWRAKQMFDWAHILHRQIYDVYSDHGLTRVQQDSLIERATDYYLSRKEYAFLPVPKSMALMDEQYYSQAFRRAYPKFNGLIWAYHWLQVGLYEPFIEATSPDETKAGVQVTLGRFWSMLESPPERFPGVMPMASAVAPRFSAAHPRAAIIFDNLHMMHDIISDILENDTVPAAGKREVIYAALDEFQDSTRNLMSMEMWRNMAEHMGGLAAMGGPATGLLPALEIAAAPSSSGHASHQGAAPPDTAAPAQAGPDHPDRMMQLHRRMMGDSVIRRRVMEDGEMRRMMQAVMPEMSPAEHREMQRMKDRNSGVKGEPTPQQKPAHPAAGQMGPKPAAADSAAHEGQHDHSGPRQ